MPELNLDSLFAVRPPEPVVTTAAPSTSQPPSRESFEDHLQRAGYQGPEVDSVADDPPAGAAPARAESPSSPQTTARGASDSASASGEPADDEPPAAEDHADGKPGEQAARQSDSGAATSQNKTDRDQSGVANPADEDADSFETTVLDSLAVAVEVPVAPRQAAVQPSAEKESKARPIASRQADPADDAARPRGRGAKSSGTSAAANGKTTGNQPQDGALSGNAAPTDAKTPTQQPDPRAVSVVAVDANANPQEAVPGAEDTASAVSAEVTAAKPNVPVQQAVVPLTTATPVVSAVASQVLKTVGEAALAPDEVLLDGARPRTERGAAGRSTKPERVSKDATDAPGAVKASPDGAVSQKPGGLAGALSAAENALETMASELASAKDARDADGDATIKDPSPKPPATGAPHARAGESARTLTNLDPAGPHSGARPSGASEVERVRFIQRVARAFQTAGDRDGSVRLRLSPPELGSLRLEVTVRGGVMTARLEAEHPAARTMLLENLPALRDRLAEQNIKIARFDVDLMGQSPGGLPEKRSEDTGSERFARSHSLPGRATREEDVPIAPAVRRAERAGEGGAQLNIIV
ncbi:MAG: flagellar hook-length control protein FliK [Pirellulales bacterium]